MCVCERVNVCVSSKVCVCVCVFVCEHVRVQPNRAGRLKHVKAQTFGPDFACLMHS